MDSYQKYRLADTLNQLPYPHRLLVLELCLLDNRSTRQQVRYQLDIMRERRWPTERFELQVFQEGLLQLEEAEDGLCRIKECHLMMMNPERSSTQSIGTATSSQEMYPAYLREFGIIA